tara:strand:- start:4772 stop:6043 length:1272 start_codon:yes stop_codon:yes gene_type:complete
LEAADGASAIDALDASIDLVLLDYRLPDTDGMEILAHVQRFNKDIPVIMMTAHSSVEHAVHAIKAGAYHYVAKPFELDSVAITVARALETSQLRRELRTLQVKTAEGSAIIGESQVMLALKRLIPRIAASPASTVLITGESGTGKDLAAHALHTQSDRRNGPFVNITCSALPAALLESEFFGHERGAFTDAKTRKEGLFQQANGGTVFLDEIGEMEVPLQAKLLRFLEEKTFRRVGGSEEISTDVRVVAATNVDLKKAVTSGKFREDLYYRLAVLTVHLPPLREREGDVDLIAAHLIKKFNGEFATTVRSLDRDAQRLLRTHPWPGNVRELRNAMERAVLLAEGDALSLDDFSFLRETAIDATVFTLPAGGIDIAELERTMVEQALQRTGDNQSQAAALIGMNRDRFRYRMKQYGLLPKAKGS